jgi:hypothetical protein
MKAKIAKIVLWPKQSGMKPRIIPFEMIGVEVITGQSQTGKSSLIAIVDYCLGAGKCTIPVGEIRDSVEWFGVVLKLPNSEMLVARRNPGMHAAIGETYLEETRKIVIRSDIEANSNVVAVVSRLNQIAELPSLALADTEELGFGSRPSFRDTAAFQFQPQHIVANPYTLFFKADTFEHQEKLKHFFPYVLGAVDRQTLELRRELRSVDAELKLKRDQLEARRARSADWLIDFQIMYSRTREFGLLPHAPDPEEMWLVDTFVRLLRPVPGLLEKQGMPQVEKGASKRMAHELAALRNEEDKLTHAILDRRRKLTKIEQLKSSTGGYSNALAVQAGRLGPLHWFSQNIAEAHDCPVCGSKSDSAAKEIDRLVGHARQVEGSIGRIEAVSEVLDKETAQLGDQLRQLEEHLSKLRSHLEELESKSEEVRQQRQTFRDIYTFVGTLKEALRNYDAADHGGTLSEAIFKLEQRARDLRVQVDQSAINRRMETALISIGKTTCHYAKILGVEQPDREVTLDIRNLTLVVAGPFGRKDHLWEIGSGANWMGYHIAALLALHEHFLTVANSPVPQFLVIDQPSQAFFPERLREGRAGGKKTAIEPAMSSDDMARVHRIFAALSEASRRTENRLQIVVIDHADEITWEGIPNIKVVERWRGGKALIPQEWLPVS